MRTEDWISTRIISPSLHQFPDKVPRRRLLILKKLWFCGSMPQIYPTNPLGKHKLNYTYLFQWWIITVSVTEMMLIELCIAYKPYDHEHSLSPHLCSTRAGRGIIFRSHADFRHTSKKTHVLKSCTILFKAFTSMRMLWFIKQPTEA